jgi:type IV pilus biogenesis protein CpaD/CtpE
MKIPRRSILGAATAGALMAGCAHAPPMVAGAPGAATEPPSAVVVTGSRLPQRVDLSSGLPRTTSAVVVWTPEQLQATGAPSTGDQLKKLTP